MDDVALTTAKIKLYILLLAKHPTNLTDSEINVMADLENDEAIQKELGPEYSRGI